MATTNEQTPIDGEEKSGIEVGDSEPKTTGYMKARLFEDAEKVTDEDVEKLDRTVPEKLSGADLREMRITSQWISTMLERVGMLFDMIRDREFTVSAKAKALTAAGLLYFVLPTDIVPDFIPGIGYVDDALILSTLWNVVKEELAAYISFRERKQNALGHV